MATGHLEANPAPLAQCITLGLTKIYLALRSQTWKTSGARKVAPAQGQILLFLRSHPHQAPTVSDIFVRTPMPAPGNLITAQCSMFRSETASSVSNALFTIRLYRRNAWQRISEG